MNQFTFQAISITKDSEGYKNMKLKQRKIELCFSL